MPRFERLDASTLGFPGGDPRVAVTVLTPRIVRVELTQTGREAAPSSVAERERAPAPFEVVDGNPLRIVTTDLRGEVETAPLGIALLDSRDDWMLGEPANVVLAAEPVTAWSGGWGESVSDK